MRGDRGTLIPSAGKMDESDLDFSTHGVLPRTIHRRREIVSLKVSRCLSYARCP